MIIKKNMVADIYYQMKDEYGNVADSNEEYAPLQYLHGYNNILPALENVLEGLTINEEKYITLDPEQTYGKYNTALVFEVDKNELGKDVELQEGLVIESTEGQEFTVRAVTNDSVTLDGNHPQAGKILNVFVKVVAVREATQEEIEQGHPLILKSSCCGPKGCC
ncbi:MAG: peptidylprolyl isomerase [Ferruginibacter sp.]